MRQRYVVVDDDPTGTQAVHDVPVFLRWSPEGLRAALESSPAIHLLTNARALAEPAAEEATFDAARAARLAAPHAQIVLRGDSTLRGHLLAEYRGVVRAAYNGREPVLMLVPALPAAGRVTLAGVHYANAVPVHETPYAEDGVFSYSSSRLLEWAEQRTDGLLPASDGVEVPVDDLRARGSEAVLEAITKAAAHGRAAVVPDVATAQDLETIADGARRAYAAGLPLLVRAAPAFTAALTGTAASGFVAAPRADDGLLVVCGSYVERSSAQLARLYEELDICPVEVSVPALLGSPGQAAGEIASAVRVVGARLGAYGLAVLATPRHRPAAARSLDAGLRVAEGLASVVRGLGRPPGVILAKGGITSHITAASGLGCDRALVLGPIATGVSLWKASTADRDIDYVVFPGNVGDDDHLSRVVSLILDR